jgi:hypothetical protein
MTHDELLAIVGSNADAWAEPSFNANALRAVVELHKPVGNPTQQCKHDFKSYPCPTIQAIKKELQ